MTLQGPTKESLRWTLPCWLKSCRAYYLHTRATDGPWMDTVIGYLDIFTKDSLDQPLTPSTTVQDGGGMGVG